MYINQKTFKMWWDIFHSSDSSLVELRILQSNGRKKTASGYFKDVDLAYNAIVRYPDGGGLYAPINKIKESCYSRYQHDMIVDSPSNTTNDAEIEGRDWILIDLDPKRPSGCNSTEAELQASRDVMRNIGIYLRDKGFSSPVIAMSGNGYHMYYHVALKNESDKAELIKTFLKVLDMNFSNDVCDVDLSVFNASRIAKVIGTRSAKGANTQERPQRESFFVKIPDKIETTDVKFIEKVAAEYPQVEAPSRLNNYNTERFDLESFISRYGIRVASRRRFNGGEKLVLEECPFDSNHKAPDSAIFKMDSGAIAFKCLHNSCSHYTWHDLRVKYDPMAYSRIDRESMYNRREYYSQVRREPPKPKEEVKGKKWLSMTDIEWKDPNTQVYIPTGIIELDSKIGGLCLGDVTLLTGRAGAGKTSLLNTMLLNIADRGYRSIVWSGEMQSSRFQSWLNQTAAGKNFVKQRQGYDDWWYCPKEVADKINAWLSDKILLRNNDYSAHWGALFDDIKEEVESIHPNVVVLDNLASMYIDCYDGDRNERQSQFIAELKNFAKVSDIHVILVVHPRKEQGNALLRMESISGTFDLVNLCDNVLLAHRVGEDFAKRATEFFGKQKTEALKVYDEVIEIGKNRSHGRVDTLIGLHYEPKSRRFQNTFDEHIVYGWQDEETPSMANTISMIEEEPDDPIGTPPDMLPF
jgi:archaellum biogenesis ATPase FlaH